MMAMSLLEKLLDRGSEKPELVIATLIGVIVVGSLGGTLWIHSLQSALSERDALFRARLVSIEERHANEVSAERTKNAILQAEAEALTSSIAPLDSTLDTMAQSLEVLARYPQFPGRLKSRLLGTMRDAREQSASLQQALKRARDLSKTADTIRSAWAPPTPISSPPRPPLLQFVAAWVVLLTTGLVAAYFVTRTRRHTRLLRYVSHRWGLRERDLVAALTNSSSLEDYANALSRIAPKRTGTVAPLLGSSGTAPEILDFFKSTLWAQESLQECARAHGIRPLWDLKIASAVRGHVKADSE